MDTELLSEARTLAAYLLFRAAAESWSVAGGAAIVEAARGGHADHARDARRGRRGWGSLA